MSPLPPIGFFGGVTAVGDYESIATVTIGAGGASSASFSSIPSTYKHLQIRGIAKSNRVDNNDAIFLQFNGDTSSNYGSHGLWGDGSGANSAQLYYPGVGTSLPWIAGDSNGANVFGGLVIDILDYTSSNKKKTIRGLQGYDNNGNGQAGFGSSLWSATPAAITSILIYPHYGTAWKQHSSFALYGIKG